MNTKLYEVKRELLELIAESEWSVDYYRNLVVDGGTDVPNKDMRVGFVAAETGHILELKKIVELIDA